MRDLWLGLTLFGWVIYIGWHLGAIRKKKQMKKKMTLDPDVSDVQEPLKSLKGLSENEAQQIERLKKVLMMAKKMLEETE